jgi:hypothetical protein
MNLLREKLYLGKYVDIRSYEIDKAKQKKENIYVYYHGNKMTISDFSKGVLLNKTPYQSKYNPDQQYYVYSFLFNPDPELTSEDLIKKGLI